MVKYQTIVHSPALIIKINFAQGFLVFDGVVLNHCSYKSKITNSIIQKVDQIMAHSFCSVKKGSSVKRRARLIAATLVAYGYCVYNYIRFGNITATQQYTLYGTAVKRPKGRTFFSPHDATKRKINSIFNMCVTVFLLLHCIS